MQNENLDVSIRVNMEIFGQLVKADKWTSAAFHFALAKMTPQRVQRIDLDDAEPQILKGADKLVKLGILKRQGESKTKFIVPKSIAFATYEPSLAHLLTLPPE